MEFRPCIDIHDGKVKQIVGGSIDDRVDSPRENFVSEKDAAYFVSLYKEKNLPGGHVIMLNRSGTPEYEASKKQALLALGAYPGGLQVGGGINPDNAADFLDAGASHVIVTSYVFRDGRVDRDALNRLVTAVGKEHLVLDLSVRRKNDKYMIVTDRWQKFTSVELCHDTLDELADCCDEFLIHGVDVEGLSAGIEEDLIRILGSRNGKKITYAGGIHDPGDIRRVRDLGQDRVNITIGSALDIFGGPLSMEDVIKEVRENRPR